MTRGIKKIVEQVKASAPKPRQGRSSRTLSMREPQFRTFQLYCRAKGITASEVLDNLIEEFLAEAGEDVATVLKEQETKEAG